MKQTNFLDHYCISTAADGSPKQVSRSGAAINYKATDTRSGELVELQLVPLAVIDPAKREQFEERALAVQKLNHPNIAHVFEVGADNEYFVFVSEFLEGETADAWLIEHGPMPPDAVLRVAIQVVRAMAAGAFQGLIHRAIQPSNLMILPGEAPDGGWPLVKLLNFSVAALELHTQSDEARELAPSVGPEFAAPEQLLKGEIDFRSEMYSLGATMCFLLTGTVPLPTSGPTSRARLRHSPALRRVPRRLRKLLAIMLHDDPEKRPQDPVVSEQELRKCLAKIEGRKEVVEQLASPLGPLVNAKVMQSKSPRAQVMRGAFAAAVLILMGAAAGAFVLPHFAPFSHREKREIGVPVGTSNNNEPVKVAPIVVKQPAAPAPPIDQQNLSPNSQPENASAGQPVPASTTAAVTDQSAERSDSIGQTAQSSTNAPLSEDTAETTRMKRSEEAAAGKSTDEEGAQNPPVATRHKLHEKRKPYSAAAGQVSNDAPVARALPVEEGDAAAKDAQQAERKSSPATAGRLSKEAPIARALPVKEADAEDAQSAHPQYIGRSREGQPLLRMPSGKTVTVEPRSNEATSAQPQQRKTPAQSETDVTPRDDQPNE